MVVRCPELVERMLKSIPRLEGVRAIVQRANCRDHACVFRSKHPEGFAGAILRVVTEIETSEASGEYVQDAIARMKAEGEHHEEVLAALVVLEEKGECAEAMEIDPADLGDYLGGNLAEDFLLTNDFLVAPRGADVNRQLVELVSNYEAYCEAGSFPSVMKVFPPREKKEGFGGWDSYS
ncbi:MAG: hypothetical protein CMO66_06645 [Verrucomicrobiales bacterium]|nr:hypothetical protein [Verrucomicrobiales bacterium]